MTTIDGKSCSICNKWHRMSEYDYGNRPNRSYCQKCSKEEQAAYSKGGKEAAKLFRENMRRKNGLL